MGVFYTTIKLLAFGLDQANKGNRNVARLVGLATSVTFYFFI